MTEGVLSGQSHEVFSLLSYLKGAVEPLNRQVEHT